MKKTLLLALVIMASATFNTATAQKKDKKKKKQATEQCCQMDAQKGLAQKNVVPQTANDSVSYAAGMMMTNGLQLYLQQQLGVDTAYMADFVTGFNEAQAKADDKKYQAYVAGTQVAQMATQRMLPGVEREFEGTDVQVSREQFYQGFADAVMGNTQVYTLEAAEQFYAARLKEVKEAKAAAARKEGNDFLAENARKEGVVTTPSGLQYKVLRQGTGTVATANDEVVVKYEGRLIDGTVFDSSYERNPQTNKFRPDQVIKGWTEALTMMPAGSKWELYIPENLAYGERQAGKIPPYSALIFTVEVDEVVKAKAAEPEKKPRKPSKNAK